MKKMLSELSGEVRKEIILCSSDPKSLDGIIVESEKGRVAFLDGTSPHVTEAQIPGAKDEIIDLGKNWDTRYLRAQKDKICKLSEEKSAAYKTAYYYLALAGKCDEICNEVIGSIYDVKESKTEALRLINEISLCREGKSDTRLTSAFCKHGRYSIDTLEKKAKRFIKISGQKEAKGLFLKDLKEALLVLCANHTLSPSPLSPLCPEAIFLPKEEILIGEALGDEVIECDKFLKKDAVLANEKTKVARGLWDYSLNEAKRWFGIASDIHFRLEEIYSSAMDFSKNDKIFSKKLSEAKSILKLS